MYATFKMIIIKIIKLIIILLMIIIMMIIINIYISSSNLLPVKALGHGILQPIVYMQENL